MKIRIKALTEKGKSALEQHLQESYKLSRTQRIARKMAGIWQEKVSDDPYILEIGSKKLGPLVQHKHLVMLAEETMQANGAEKGIDYEVE